jgi:carbonic anhydrase
MFNRNVGSVLAALVVASLGAHATAEGTAPHWNYRGATGPGRWAQLGSEFGACRPGRAQSPIDIRQDTVQKAELPPIVFAYKRSPLKVIDNGHTIQVNYAPGNTIDIGGHRYELVQFHFHRPSEEKIDGKHYDMVAHLVHKDAEGRLAVVAVLLAPGAINRMVAAVWSNLPSHKETEVAVQGVEIDASDLLPSDRAYYTFDGSLTTPPCSEGVTWFVLKHPSTLSNGEIERFARAYSMNARPVQPLNGRRVRASQ